MLALIPFLVREDTRRWAVALTGTLLATALAVFVLKIAVGRARPIVALAGVHPLYGSPTDFSFPSGHAAGSFATAAFVFVVLRRHAELNPAAARAMYLLCSLCVAVAMTIGYSRVYLGVHFPGDVLTGALLGSIFGAAGGYAYVTRSAEAANGDVKSRAKLAPEDIAGAD